MKGQKYRGIYIGYGRQRSEFQSANGPLSLDKMVFAVKGRHFDTLEEAKAYIDNLKPTGEEC